MMITLILITLLLMLGGFVFPLGVPAQPWTYSRGLNAILFVVILILLILHLVGKPPFA
jgi:hypothetical protein